MDMTALGRTGLQVTAFGLGTGPLGGFVRRPVGPETARETLEAAWEAGIRLFDTAPWYGLGAAETALGEFLPSLPRDAFVLSTKVGRVLEPRAQGDAADTHWANPLPNVYHFDYSRDGVLRSFEDSLRRLRVDHVDLLLIHDLEPGAHGGEEGFQRTLAQLDGGGGFRALAELRDASVVSGIGLGINDSAVVPRLLERFDLDVVLQAGEWTLLDQRALDTALPACARAGAAVIVGAPFNSGILATGASPGATFDHEPPPPEIAARVKRLAAVCERNGVSLRAAALAFPFGHPAVAAVIPGAAHPREVEENVASFHSPIPDDLWLQLRTEGLLRADAPLPLSGVR